MMDGYIIKKNTNLQEGISGSMLFECQFSDYELYQILESNGYKTTNQNKDILKKGLQEGRYYIEDELDSALLEEFKDFLNEEPIILGEDILTEGKILNKIRWKLALFSLRFLSNTSINAFFIAYYADKKTGEATEAGKEFCRKPRKEKLAKMRELANGMKEEDKQKVINSQAAKQCEKSAIWSGLTAIGAGITTGMTAHAMSQANTGEIVAKVSSGAWENYGKAIGSIDFSNKAKWTFGSLAGIFASLSSMLFGLMWGSIIVAGVATVKGVLSVHKANTLRRDEIMADLKGKMNPAIAKGLAVQYKEEFKAEKKK